MFGFKKKSAAKTKTGKRSRSNHPKKRMKNPRTRKTAVKSKVNLALSGAMRDLETEIKSLARQKNTLKGSLQNTVKSIDTDHDLEKKLQEQIAKIVEEEARLNKRKKALQAKIDSVSDKINKVAKIRTEMSDV